MYLLSTPNLERNFQHCVREHIGGFPGGSVLKNQPDNAGDAGDSGLIPGMKKQRVLKVWKRDRLIVRLSSNFYQEVVFGLGLDR